MKRADSLNYFLTLTLTLIMYVGFTTDSLAQAGDDEPDLFGVFAIIDEPPGPNCANGGLLIAAGPDLNLNGVLNFFEVHQTGYVCNGESGDGNGIPGPQGPTGPAGPAGPAGLQGDPGPQGPAGPAGANGTAGPPGAQGPEGPTGPAGPPGSGGYTTLIEASNESSGGGCGIETGTRIDVGLDNGDGAETENDGILGPGEIDNTFFACNGADGATGGVGATGPAGPAGATGATGPAGPAGATGATGPAGATGGVGPQGPAGPAGADGGVGPQGPTGPAGADATSICLSAEILLANGSCLNILDLLTGNKIAFISSVTTNGDFITSAAALFPDDCTGFTSGPDAGDCICQQLASAQSLDGLYKAWLAINPNNDPNINFVRSNNPYLMVGGDFLTDLIAVDYNDLTDGLGIDNQLDNDESGTVVAASHVWTAALPDGNGSGPVNTCMEWTSSDSGTLGFYGRSDRNNTSWASAAADTCDTLNRLYCFEQ